MRSNKLKLYTVYFAWCKYLIIFNYFKQKYNPLMSLLFKLVNCEYAYLWYEIVVIANYYPLADVQTMG